MQAKEYKPKVVGPCCLIGLGVGLMFLGIIGAIFGLIIGVIVGIILNSVMSNTYQSVMICQHCGYVSKPISQVNLSTEHHPLFCNPDESNLEIIRNDIHKGTIVVIRVRIDDYPHFDIGDNSTINLKVPEGVHTIFYEQVNGIGRQKNKGQLSVSVDNKKSIMISFSRNGLVVR